MLLRLCRISACVDALMDDEISNDCSFIMKGNWSPYWGEIGDKVFFRAVETWIRGTGHENYQH